MINCRNVCNGEETLRFQGTIAVNYITSHDVEGRRKERLWNFLHNVNIKDGDDKK
jgi:hypothetical protein